MLAALCAFWCSYVRGRALLIFQSRRLRSGRVRHHRNGYLMFEKVQLDCTFISSLNLVGYRLTVVLYDACFHFKRRVMHVQPLNRQQVRLTPCGGNEVPQYSNPPLQMLHICKTFVGIRSSLLSSPRAGRSPVCTENA